MSVGTLQLHRFNGIESFTVEKAEISYFKNEGSGFVVSFSGKTGAAISTLSDSQDLKARPNFEFTLLLPKIPQLALTVGKSFQIPKGHDEKKADFWTRLYYAEHGIVDDVTIRIAARVEQTYRVAINGITTDVIHYDGSKPPTKIEILAEFTLKA